MVYLDIPTFTTTKNHPKCSCKLYHSHGNLLCRSQKPSFWPLPRSSLWTLGHVLFVTGALSWGSFSFHHFSLGSKNIQIYANVQKYPYYTALFRLVIFHDHPDDATPLGFLQETQLAEGQKDTAPRVRSPNGTVTYCYHVLVYISLGNKIPFGDGDPEHQAHCS